MLAEEAGFEVGDRIVSANGEVIETWMQWVKVVRARPGESIDVGILRDKQLMKLEVVPLSRSLGW